jgi:hypothetical protein
MDPATKCQQPIYRETHYLTRRLIDLLMQANCSRSTIRMALERFPGTVEAAMASLLEECFPLLKELAEDKDRYPFRFDN